MRATEKDFVDIKICFFINDDLIFTAFLGLIKSRTETSRILKFFLSFIHFSSATLIAVYNFKSDEGKKANIMVPKALFLFIGVQKTVPQSMVLWCAEHFELKKLKGPRSCLRI